MEDNPHVIEDNMLNEKTINSLPTPSYISSKQASIKSTIAPIINEDPFVLSQ